MRVNNIELFLGRVIGPYSVLDLKYELKYPGTKSSPTLMQSVTGIRPINAFQNVFIGQPQQPADAHYINPVSTSRPYHNPYHTSNNQPYYSPLPNSQSNHYNNPNNNHQPIYSNHPKPTAQPPSYNNPYTTPYYNPFPTTQTATSQPSIYSNNDKPTVPPSSYNKPTPSTTLFTTPSTTQYDTPLTTTTKATTKITTQAISTTPRMIKTTSRPVNNPSSTYSSGKRKSRQK